MFLFPESSSSKEQQKSSCPKVYKIGLYKSKETQCQECPDPWETEENTCDNLEKISFSLTVSTETSSSEIIPIEIDKGRKKGLFSSNPESRAVLKQLRNKMEQKCPEEPWEINIYDNLPKESSDKPVFVPEFLGGLMSRSREDLEKVIPLIRRSVQQRTSISTSKRRKSITKQHLSAQTANVITEPEELITKKEVISNTVNGTFVNKTSHDEINVNPLTDLNSIYEREQMKNVPCYDEHITKSAQVDDGSSNNLRQEDNLISRTVNSINDKNSENNIYDSPTVNNTKPTVMSVHVHGDFLSFAEVNKFINALEVTQNGRYKDEANLFCETTYQKIPSNSNSTERDINQSITSNNNFFDISTSHIVTSKSLSKGEVKCKCSVSSGELHICKDNDIESQKKTNVLSQKIQRKHSFKRTYFKNWITYYVKNDPDLNDSSKNGSNK